MLFDRMGETMVKAVMEAIPFEITVIDANDEVIAWNKHETRLFTRPMTTMGRNIRQCHPEESLPKVERLVEEMRAGKRDSARFWIDMRGRKVLIEFYALRDDKKNYVGCMECTRDVTDIQNLQGERRLLDEV